MLDEIMSFGTRVRQPTLKSIRCQAFSERQRTRAFIPWERGVELVWGNISTSLYISCNNVFSKCVTATRKSEYTSVALKGSIREDITMHQTIANTVGRFHHKTCRTFQKGLLSVNIALFVRGPFCSHGRAFELGSASDR